MPPKKTERPKKNTQQANKGRKNPHARSDQKRAEDLAQIVEYRLRHMPWRTIAERLGISISLAYNDYRAHLELVYPSDTDLRAAVREELVRIEKLRARPFQQAEAGDLEALDSWMRLTELRHKFLGSKPELLHRLDEHEKTLNESQEAMVLGVLTRTLNRAGCDEAQAALYIAQAFEEIAGGGGIEGEEVTEETDMGEGFDPVAMLQLGGPGGPVDAEDAP